MLYSCSSRGFRPFINCPLYINIFNWPHHSFSSLQRCGKRQLKYSNSSSSTTFHLTQQHYSKNQTDYHRYRGVDTRKVISTYNKGTGATSTVFSTAVTKSKKMSASAMFLSTQEPSQVDLEKMLTVDVLNLEELDVDLYRGTHLWKPPSARSVFGGQIVGQALAAAGKTIENSEVTTHSMHCYFVRPGDPDKPVIYRVNRTRDGKSFATRSVSAIQNGKPILTLQASYHNEGGETVGPPLLQPAMPTVPHYSELSTLEEYISTTLDKANFSEEKKAYIKQKYASVTTIPLEIRPVHPEIFTRQIAADEAKSMLWVRARGHVGSNQNLNRCLAAYITDWSLLWTALAKTPKAQIKMMASLDHSMWFYKPFQADEWMLYENWACVSGNNRALTQGRLWREDGILALTVAQEGVIRAKL